MMLDKTDCDGFDQVDRDALTRAMEIASRDPARREQLEAKIVEDGWREAAEFAAAHCQRIALALKPWQEPPACTYDDADASRLLDRMLARGISQWEPDPAKALAEVAAKRRKRKPK
jgi:hypothetical protein